MLINLRTLISHHRTNAALVVITIVMTIVTLNLMRTLPIVWSSLSPRLSTAHEFRLHSLFRPDHKRDIPVLVIGDSLFQATVWPQVSNIPGARQFIQNQFDADDAAEILQGLRKGQAHSQTRVCAIVLQISPQFMIRARRIGADRQNTQFLESVGLIDLLNPFETRQTFELVQNWASTSTNTPSNTQFHGRLARLVGQGRFPDPTFENWTVIERALNAGRWHANLVVDTRETNYHEAEGLASALEGKLDTLVAVSEQIKVGDIGSSVAVPEAPCEPISAAS